MSTDQPAVEPADTQATMCAALVGQWVADGLRDAFIAPGSRSTPMAAALADHPAVSVEIFHDERSASFAALGSALATGRPAAVLCTSGTAATHFHAAVVEAHQSAVPMLVLTADRPAELHGVGAPQTIEQTGLYGGAPRWAVDVPPAEPSGRLAWPALAARAWRAATSVRPGPIHLNLRFREPLLGTPRALPPTVDWPSDAFPAQGWMAEVPTGIGERRGVIIAGHGVDGDGADAVAALGAQLNWPVLADARSRCRGLAGSVAAFDALLRVPDFADRHRPEIVVQLGMAPASKVLGQWLAGSAGCRHLAVSPWGLVSDPQLLGALQVHAPIGQWCAAAGAKFGGSAERSWLDSWMSAQAAADEAIAEAVNGTWGEPSVARHLGGLPVGHHLVVSSSMPVRDLEWFGPNRRGPRVHSNRGANGIDGVLATAIGVATAGVPAVALLGDVAVLHDASSLTALARRAIDLTVVVVHNDGGGIFSFLPQAGVLEHERFETLFGTPHGTDLVALAAAHHLPATTVTSPSELDAVLVGHGPRLAVVHTERAANVELHRHINAAVANAVRAERSR